MKSKLNQVNGEQRPGARVSLLFCGLPLFVMLVWAGCKPEAKVAGDMNPTGTYTLVSVDMKQLPCTLAHEGSPTVKSGVFIINADGTCSSKVTFSVRSGRDSSREVKATYTRQGATLTMKWEGAGMTTGTVEGDTFTMNNEGMIFAYHK